jgi:hypothetical protein
MRSLAIAAALTLMGGAAIAAPASVSVTIGPKLSAAAHKTYGDRDVAELATDLRKDVERELAKTGAHDGARVELTLVDALPNRPTFKQLGDRPGLSLRSISVGGARIEGKVTEANGAITPVSFKYYTTDIRDVAVQGATTWSDAQQAIDMFAHRLGKGETLAMR